ncbi:uncharacterized protein K452DRAFT_289618 [Aplosporella prunicola CBS 121167]|uniref:AB hydrolase-1 domain-containing protein n=1 Tax=Aplosporella prunicola CBS 121167 TaxID=1176127 RepID=A0A6A6B7T1_9PEZI|nr:uncharacterized protein K452DRAFT_289618 [Aplosporella prunicola CBS 121167]KAF2139618.1 hypothetical protein K452DRAFT_289618 [Aplosporella prunicola CBS 121167]
MAPIKTIAWRSFMYAYGLLAGLLWILKAVLNGSALQRPSKKAKHELAAARDKLWNLSLEPLPGFKHAFFTTDAGVSLHYVVSSRPVSSSPNLVILLHGFPDSWALWRDFLQEERLEDDTVYVAMDLPGYGGSDNLEEYNAYNVLEAVASFVLGMRDEHTSADGVDSLERGQVLLVSHDWGAAVACRLAAEAPQLADHFIVTSVVHPSLVYANIQSRISSARQMLCTFSHHPLSSRPRILRNAITTLSPLATQLLKSHYIFVFLLPPALLRIISTLVGSWFLQAVHRSASANVDVVEAIASSVGPAPEQCTEAPSTAADPPPGKGGLTYPAAVRQRARASDAGLSQKIRYYREGLTFGEWRKSLQTILALSALEPSAPMLQPRKDSAASTGSGKSTGGTNGPASGSLHHRRRSSTPGARPRSNSLAVGGTVFDPNPHGAFKAPATLVVGMRDLAFEWRLALEGIAEYLGKGGAVVSLEGLGHWFVRDEEGLRVLGRIVRNALGEMDGVDGASAAVVNGKGAFGVGATPAVAGGLRNVPGVKVLWEG